MHRIQCTHCGKIIPIPPDDTGSLVVCMACGQRNESPGPQRYIVGDPHLQQTAQQWAALRSAVQRDANTWRKATGQPPIPPPTPVIPPIAPHDDAPSVEAIARAAVGKPVGTASAAMRATFASPAAWAIGALLVILAILLPYAIAQLMRPDAPDYSDLLAMQRSAESQATAGDLSAARTTYAQLLATAEARQVDDPMILERLAKAKTDRQRIEDLLVEQARQKRAAALAAIAEQQQGSQPQTSPTTQPSPNITIARDAPPPATRIAPATQPTIAAAPATGPTTAPAVAMRAVIPDLPPLPRPRIRASKPEDEFITDAEIGDSIQRGADFLLSQFHNNRLKGDRDSGLNALVVYALLQCGQAIPDERLNARAKLMKGLIDEMRKSHISGYETYGRGIRATALAVYNRAEDREVLKSDVAWLLNATKTGAYTYGEGNRLVPGHWDNSNSQYGLLGVWSGAEVGIEVPRTYWSNVQKHWYECQLESGQWDYTRGGYRSSGTLSMTVAGIASLFVTHDYLEAPQFGTQVGREPFSRPLARGLAWLEEGDNCLDLGSGWPGYTLYGIERVGLASGFKYFGTHDWYRELARSVIDNQDEDGSWSNRGRMRLRWEDPGREELIETSFSLLFLARGRHPIIMNKLRFNGAWANRPRDLANLSRFASRELERPLNWQVVPIERDWTDWTDSPILYLASHQPPKLTETEITKLRRFIDAGGILFTQADGGSENFNSFVLDLSRKLLPTFEWIDLPLDHEIYSLNYRVEPKPKLRCITNGARILMLHCPYDLAQHWQLRAEKTQRPIFELGVNLFIYAAGKADLRNRLSSPYLPPPRLMRSAHQLRLARLKYGGLWDPEPGAFSRFARWFSYQTGYDLNITPIAIPEMDPQKFPIIHVTGTAPWTCSEAEGAVIRRYVSDGGILVIDACGGAWPFGQSISSHLIPKMFADAPMTILSPTHPLLAGSAEGMDNLTKSSLRPFTEQKLGKSAGRIEMYSLGKGKIIYSSIDLTCGLLGTNTWSILGHRPAFAQSFLKNVLLWTADGAVD